MADKIEQVSAEELAHEIVTTFWGTGLELEKAIDDAIKAYVKVAKKNGFLQGLRKALQAVEGTQFHANTVAGTFRNAFEAIAAEIHHVLYGAEETEYLDGPDHYMEYGDKD